MSQLITLSRTNPEFQRYLLGDVEDKVVIPVRTIQANTEYEMVTFRLLDGVERPAGWWISIIRPGSVLLSLLPLFYVLAMLNQSKIIFSPVNAVLSAVGVALLHAAALFFNDYFDHMKGLDRDFAYSGSRAIQQGFVSAQKVYQIGLALVLTATVIGAAVLWRQPGALYLVAAVALFGVFEYTSDRLDMKYKVGGEGVIFLVFGPILLMGYSLAVSGLVPLEILVFGIFWGLQLAADQLLRNFSQGMFHERAGVKTVIQRLGFEKSRLLISVMFFACDAILWALAWKFNHFYLPIAGIYFLLCIFLISGIFKIHSPVSSRFEAVKRLGRNICYFSGMGLIAVELVTSWSL